ncbi:MAG: mannonate dehydratase [Clostridiales Family XIII bacterium]|jgi:mannonate dehydratase|nr:mannonate dehydratase [Clostridiales Family XIII bacterium]
MEMTFRWYGRGNDTITLDMIRQIPGVKGIVWSLHDIPAGDVWTQERIVDEVNYIKSKGFDADVVESVNIHESIKLGIPARDQYIENYKETLRILGANGIKVVCYNFMPVFDWLRTELYKEMPDGSTAMYFEKSKVENQTAESIVKEFEDNAKGMTLPGWEPERLADLKGLFAAYADITEDDLFDNLAYFLQAVVPVAEEVGIKMAIHPDDPPWPIFGLPRIVRDEEHLEKLLNIIDSPSNSLTICTGSLGSSAGNNLPELVRKFGSRGRIAFIHVRNVKRFEDGSFIESSHRTQDGSVDIVDVVRALYEVGFTGYCRPDHGRHLWNEVSRPGYGLYDRALGIMYLWGIWDTLVDEHGAIATK